MIDDELYFELRRFAAGVRVVVLSDSCHSGTVTRARSLTPPPPGQRSKLMPAAVGQRVYAAHKAHYDRLQADVALRAEAERKARSADPDQALAQLALTGAAAEAQILLGPIRLAVILISGCQDNQTSMDGEHKGAFTEQ